MKKTVGVIIVLSVIVSALLLYSRPFTCSGGPGVKLGDELLMSKYHHLIEGKKIGLITNQSGITGEGKSIIDVLANDQSARLAALYGPEHGIDGTAKAGQYVESYIHQKLGIPVYSLYGQTRMPTGEMLGDVDLLIFDIQDIGARSYTYISTLNYCMVAAQKYNKQIIVLDRPNPLGGEIVEGPVLEDPYKSFVGIDNLPMAHGMTVGELALFFNRKIGADLKVIPMEGYTRKMIYQDTGLPWVPTSPNIPDLDSVFGYMATGLGEGTGIFQADKFKWIGGKGIDSLKFAGLLNRAGLPGVTFVPEDRGEAGGVRLKITDPHAFNPARAGIYALAYAHSLNNFKVPKSGNTVVMFDKIMGTDKIGQYLDQGLTPQQIEAKYAAALNKFKEERKKYLLYGYEPQKQVTVIVRGIPLNFDTDPYIDANSRLMVPLRAIAEALGAKAQWDNLNRTATIVGDGRTVVFKIGSTAATVNGQQKRMDTSPVIKNDRTLIPARYVSEYLGFSVAWDQTSRTVTID
ncbi:MAG: exo-beta-N-acetylmuramidase NamZ domain-containing protein [Bacillota bacterium]